MCLLPVCLEEWWQAEEEVVVFPIEGMLCGWKEHVSAMNAYPGLSLRSEGRLLALDRELLPGP